jgi:hypothetical protein
MHASYTWDFCLQIFQGLNRHEACRWFWSLENDNDHADGNDECHDTNASSYAFGSNILMIQIKLVEMV